MQFYREFSDNTFWFFKENFNEETWKNFIEMQDYTDKLCKSIHVPGVKFRTMKEVNGLYTLEDRVEEIFPSTLSNIEIFIRISKLLVVFYKHYYREEYPDFSDFEVINDIVYIPNVCNYTIINSVLGNNTKNYLIIEYDNPHYTKVKSVIDKYSYLEKFDSKLISSNIKKMVKEIEAIVNT